MGRMNRIRKQVDDIGLGCDETVYSLGSMYKIHFQSDNNRRVFKRICNGSHGVSCMLGLHMLRA